MRDGARYEGEWRDDKQRGHGVMRWANGERYEGGFAGGRKHGEGRYSWPDGSSHAGAWQQGLRHGKGVTTWKDGLRPVRLDTHFYSPARPPDRLPAPSPSGCALRVGTAPSKRGGVPRSMDNAPAVVVADALCPLKRRRLPRRLESQYWKGQKQGPQLFVFPGGLRHEAGSAPLPQRLEREVLAAEPPRKRRRLSSAQAVDEGTHIPGVNWDKQRRKWRAKYKSRPIGRFDTKAEAVEALAAARTAAERGGRKRSNSAARRGKGAG